MNILYIEDEPNDAALVDLYVQSTPHHLTVASSTTEAEDALATQPDLILIDVLLGRNRDGLMIARALREEGDTRPLIAVTGLSTPQDMAECQQVGFTDILNKPFTINQLAELIEQYSI